MYNAEPTKIVADKVRITGPKIDGGYTVSFDVGEYEQLNIVKLMAIPQQTILKVTIEPEGV